MKRRLHSYKAIDESDLFNCPIEEKDRSLMNVVFVTGDPELDKSSLPAKEEGLVNLGGHRTVEVCVPAYTMQCQ